MLVAERLGQTEPELGQTAERAAVPCAAAWYGAALQRDHRPVVPLLSLLLPPLLLVDISIHLLSALLPRRDSDMDPLPVTRFVR